MGLSDRVAIPLLAVGVTVCVAYGVTEMVAVRSWRRLFAHAK